MSNEPTFPPDFGKKNLTDQVLGIRRAVETVVSTLQDRTTIREVWNVPVRNRVLGGGPSGAPAAVSDGPGSLVGDFEYAFTYESPYLGGETRMSPGGSTGAFAGDAAAVTGARSTDPQMTLVNIYRRPTGGTNLEWFFVASVANPAAGPWAYTDDAPIQDIFTNPTPLTFYCPLWAVCGPGYRLRRVKIRPMGDLAADASNYWILHLYLQRLNAEWPSPMTRYMDTSLSGMSSKGLLNAFIASPAGPPRVDLDFPMPENATLYLGLRGVGAPQPWPELSCQVEVTRQEA